MFPNARKQPEGPVNPRTEGFLGPVWSETPSTFHNEENGPFLRSPASPRSQKPRAGAPRPQNALENHDPLGPCPAMISARPEFSVPGGARQPGSTTARNPNGGPVFRASVSLKGLRTTDNQFEGDREISRLLG